MKLIVKKVDVWAATIEDRPGGLAQKLTQLSAAGANLEFVIARRAPGRPGEGVVFVTPVKGARQTATAKAAGFQITDSLHSLRVEGADRPGPGAKIAQALGAAGINLRGLSAAAIGRKFVAHLALDSAADAATAAGVLKKVA